MSNELKKYKGVESDNVQEIITQVQKFRFNENDEATQRSIKDFYKNITGRKFTENERLMLMSSLNQMSEFSNFLLGRFLSEEEKSIQEKYDNWREYGSEPDKKPPYKSLSGFLEYHQETLGVSRSKAYYCKDLYENYTVDDILKIGVKKVLVTSLIKNREIRSAIIDKAAAEDWSMDELVAVTRTIKKAEIISNEKELKKIVNSVLKTPEDLEENELKIMAYHDQQVQETKDEQSRMLKKYSFNIEIQAGSDKAILLTAKSKKQRDYLNRALVHYEKAIKSYIQRCEESD